MDENIQQNSNKNGMHIFETRSGKQQKAFKSAPPQTPLLSYKIALKTRFTRLRCMFSVCVCVCLVCVCVFSVCVCVCVFSVCVCVCVCVCVYLYKIL